MTTGARPEPDSSTGQWWPSPPIGSGSLTAGLPLWSTESARQRWPSQPVGDVEQPTSDQHPLGRHGDPSHLVAPVRLLLTDRDEPVDADWRRRSPRHQSVIGRQTPLDRRTL